MPPISYSRDSSRYDEISDSSKSANPNWFIWLTQIL